MAKRSRLTNNADETDIASLLSGDVVFSIPFFQRSYKWKPTRLQQLNEDILKIVDEALEFHFLGAIIIHGRNSNPSDPKIYEVIDGQQRITTLVLYIAAAIKVLAEGDDIAEAANLFLKYLAIPRDTNIPSNLKLHPCKEDRAQFNAVIDELLRIKPLREKLASVTLKRLPSSGPGSGVLRKNFRTALRFFKSEFDQGGMDRVRAVYEAVLESMSVVQIDVWDPTNGPKIFDSLNSRQEPMTIGDLVRNEIFSKVAEEHPDTIEQIDQESWQPFYQRFQEDGQNRFDAYFFPYGLTQNPNLKKSEVYGALREAWRQIDDPRVIVDHLQFYQDAFLDIVAGTNRQKHSVQVAHLLRNLHLAAAPGSTLPFLMQLSRAVVDKALAEKDAIETLEVIESFLVRRAICGLEPTGLHAVFKRLWVDCKSHPTKALVEHQIRQHKTVVWPTNQALREAVRTRPLYGASITPYVIREYDRSLGGDQPDNPSWIEHVLPETPSKEWLNDFTKEEHQAMKDLLGNLIPLSGSMNIQIGNRPYSAKRARYKDDSMFKSARQFAATYQTWRPTDIEARTTEIASWAEVRWPY